MLVPARNFDVTFPPQTTPKSTNETSRTNRRTRAKLVRIETINRLEEHKQSTAEEEQATRRAETIDG